MNEIVPIGSIESKILLIRGQKVMLDRDLARLYGVETRQLKRQVRRNKERFPSDFMFILSHEEIEALVCHFGTPFRSYLGGTDPFVFTEHGILMLSSVLKSKTAIQINIQIMRIFNKLRKDLSTHKKLAEKVRELEQKCDARFKAVFAALQKLIQPPDNEPKRGIGFLR